MYNRVDWEANNACYITFPSNFPSYFVYVQGFFVVYCMFWYGNNNKKLGENPAVASKTYI